MQRVATPLITSLDTEEKVIDFLDTIPHTIWHEDYKGGLLRESSSIDPSHEMDDLVDQMGFNTRMVVFLYGKEDY